MTDERFDQLIRDTLEWHATRAVATQPTLRQATAKLAERVVPATGTVRGRLTLSPAATGSLNLMLLLLLLLLTFVAAVYVGALLLREPPFTRPGPFGFATDCSIPLDSGLAFDEPANATVLRFTSPDGPDADEESDYLTVYADGRFVQDVSDPGETRDQSIAGSQLLVRRLTLEGVSLLLDRVSDSGLSPGCRNLETQGSTGTLTAQTRNGATDVSWGSGGVGVSHALTDEAELALIELNDDLARPEQWLPDEAWVDSNALTVKPDHWLIYLTLRPTGHQPGDTIELPDGNVVDGSDPRIQSVELPGGSEPLSYGVELLLSDPSGPGSSIRCAEATEEEAVAVAGSLEELANGVGLGTDGEGELFTEDLTGSIAFGIQPVFGAGYDCVDFAATWQIATAPAPSPSPKLPIGDLAEVDPCTLVSLEAAALLGANDVERRASRLPLGTPSHACVVLDSNVDAEVPTDVPDALPPGYRAVVSLYPRTLAAATAQELVDAVFGAGLTPDEPGERRIWTRQCESDGLPCGNTIVGWTRSQLLFFEFTTAATPLETIEPSGEWSLTWLPEVTPEEAQAFVDALLGDLED